MSLHQNNELLFCFETFLKLFCRYFFLNYKINMTRGNQRELARAKNMKKQQGGKGKKGDEQAGNKGSHLVKRQERDAEVMRLKQQKAAEKKGAEGGAGTSKQ